MVKKNFSLVFPENQKRDSNLPTTDSLAFDDLGDFIEERDRIKREAERRLDAELRVDYSNFGNHVFFDSATSKYSVAQAKVLNQYPFNGTKEEKDAFHLTGSGYEKYIFDQWPRHVGYSEFDGTSQYISASDAGNKLLIGSSSFYVSAWINPLIDGSRTIISHLSQSGANKWGFVMSVKDITPVSVVVQIYSGSSNLGLTASFGAYTGSFNNVSFFYDKGLNSASLYINSSSIQTVAINSKITGPIEYKSSTFKIASGVLGDSMYSGTLGEVRIALTASTLWHGKNYNRPIDSESPVKLRYSFNEGVVDDAAIDAIVVDYSKNALHGRFVNYSSASRVSGAIMVDDPGDPILYSFHSRVVSFSASALASASLHDRSNNGQIFNFIPEYVLREDDKASGLYRSFTLAMARFLDELKLYIDQFDNLKVTNHDDLNDAPDLFLPMAQRYFGWKVTEHFGNANPLALFFGENILASGSLDTPLVEIKNQFWRRILNNLPYLLKTKGKRDGLDSFFNVLGVNKANINIKEYGYLPGGSIQDVRVHKQKDIPMLAFGTGSAASVSSSISSVALSTTSDLKEWTSEVWIQPPYVSASYAQRLLTGAMASFRDATTSSVEYGWMRDSVSAETGRFYLSSSWPADNFFTSSDVNFDGSKYHVAVGRDTNTKAFIQIRRVDNDVLDVDKQESSSFNFALSGSNYLTASVGSAHSYRPGRFSQGYMTEFRLWNRQLSSSEVNDHALHFESVGTRDPKAPSSPLLLHWSLSEDRSSTAAGGLENIVDLSRNNNVGTGSLFEASIKPYNRFLLDYNYLSPSLDLRWTENKIRIRNKSELTIDDLAEDTNQVSLEFNLIDSLNEDISKIFSTFDVFNNDVGNPVNKYRDEYSVLEGLRRVYFERLGDSLNFTTFFNLFKWFDKKLSDSIKQLLPARVQFIGGEQVVESHFLERPKYGYKYPVFRTPKDIPEGIMSASGEFTADKMLTLPNSPPATMLGTAAANRMDKDYLVSAAQPGLSVKTISVVQSSSASNASTASLPIDYGTALTTGNTLIAVLATQGTPTVITGVTQDGTTWTEVTGSRCDANGNSVSIWYAPSVTGASTRVWAAPTSTTKVVGIVFEYSGILLDSPVDTFTASNDEAYLAANVNMPFSGTATSTSQPIWIWGYNTIPLRTPGTATKGFEEQYRFSDASSVIAFLHNQSTPPLSEPTSDITFSDKVVYAQAAAAFKRGSEVHPLRSGIDPDYSLVVPTADLSQSPVSTYEAGGDGRFLRNSTINLPSGSALVRPIKVSGDTTRDVNDPNSGLNFNNEFAKKLLSIKDRDNQE